MAESFTCCCGAPIAPKENISSTGQIFNVFGASFICIQLQLLMVLGKNLKRNGILVKYLNFKLNAILGFDGSHSNLKYTFLPIVIELRIMLQPFIVFLSTLCFLCHNLLT